MSLGLTLGSILVAFELFGALFGINLGLFGGLIWGCVGTSLGLCWGCFGDSFIVLILVLFFNISICFLNFSCALINQLINQYYNR